MLYTFFVKSQENVNGKKKMLNDVIFHQNIFKKVMIWYNINRKDLMRMKYNIRGDRLEVTDAINNYVESKLDRLNKYFKEDDILANVLLRVRGNSQIIEVTIPTDKFILRSEEEDKDLYAAIDLVTDKLERQIRKNKTRLNKQNAENKYKEFNFEYESNKEEEFEEELIVKRKNIEMKPMDEEEAILQMNLLGHEFFVYKDMHTDKICVLYKRKDGNYGLIETK
jgi:putative sigma-54 modulation protein